MFLSQIWKNAVEQDGIVSAVPPLDTPEITEAIPLNDYSLFLYYTTGEYRVYDVKPLLNAGVFEVLKDMEVFRKVQLHETVSWCDGKIDIAPETLYADSLAISQEDTLVETLEDMEDAYLGETACTEFIQSREKPVSHEELGKELGLSDQIKDRCKEKKGSAL